MTDDASRPDGSVSSEGLGLVERLRTDVLWHQRRGNETIARDCQEAADEIDRLRSMLGALDSHGRYWIENRGRIIDAVTAAGFQIVSNRDRCWLLPLKA